MLTITNGSIAMSPTLFAVLISTFASTFAGRKEYEGHWQNLRTIADRYGLKPKHGQDALKDEDAFVIGDDDDSLYGFEAPVLPPTDHAAAVDNLRKQLAAMFGISEDELKAEEARLANGESPYGVESPIPTVIDNEDDDNYEDDEPEARTSGGCPGGCGML